jgi:putative ABC transport system substrate-binding protein
MKDRRLRSYILHLAALCLALAAPAVAQERIWRLGVLNVGESSFGVLDVTLGELAVRGFAQNRNLQVLERRANGHLERLPTLAAELAAAKVDIVVAVSDEALRAAFDALPTTPIVASFATVDPVAAGYAASRGQPGGFVTGQFVPRAELEAKRLALLLEGVRVTRRVAVMAEPGQHATIAMLRSVAAQRGVELLAFEAVSQPDFGKAFADARAADAEAMMILSSEIFSLYGPGLGTLSVAARLPAVCETATMVRYGGCLMSYGFDRIEVRRRTADYIARILQGTPPGSLPIEEPTRYELVVNLQTARALGIEVSSSVLARADEVLE